MGMNMGMGNNMMGGGPMGMSGPMGGGPMGGGPMGNSMSGPMGSMMDGPMQPGQQQAQQQQLMAPQQQQQQQQQMKQQGGNSTMEAQYMQQQSQIFVFSTNLANKAAEAVLNGQFPTIIAFHCSQPATKKILEVSESRQAISRPLVATDLYGHCRSTRRRTRTTEARPTGCNKFLCRAAATPAVRA